MLKSGKTHGPNRFITETNFIKENIINSFKFNEIECNFCWVSFWLACIKNVTEMMLFVS